MLLIEERPESLAAYETVPMAFEIRSRVNLVVLRASNGATITEIPEPFRRKDYDAFPDSRPTALPSQFDMANWLIVAAYEGEKRLGGLIAARDTPGCDMLEGRADIVVPFDVRVDPAAQGQGVGRRLFEYTVDWARRHSCTELHVETQDVNVAACRFYRAMGCDLHSIKEGAYGPELDEAMIIWRLPL